MKANRARIITDAFTRIHSFAVENTSKGVCIHYQGCHAYFVRESCFWPFVFNLSRVGHEEGQVAEIEAELSA